MAADQTPKDLGELIPDYWQIYLSYTFKSLNFQSSDSQVQRAKIWIKLYAFKFINKMTPDGPGRLDMFFKTIFIKYLKKKNS